MLAVRVCLVRWRKLSGSDRTEFGSKPLAEEAVTIARDSVAISRIDRIKEAGWTGNLLAIYRNYIFRRFFFLLFVIWVASTVIFLIPRLSGQDPVKEKLLLEAQRGGALQTGLDEMAATYQRRLGLDQPLFTQYRNFMFDLARFESTLVDGRRSSFTKNETIYFSMVKEYSSDGVHLNELGRKIVAEQFLIFLAKLSS